MSKYKKIEKLMARGCNILGSKYAILGGAMTWISESNLVSAMSNEGIFGILASGAMNGDILRDELALTQQKTSNNFGVNIILMNPELHNLIDVCGEKKVSHVILAGGMPDREVLDKIHAYGIQAISFAQSLAIAKRLFKNGIDAIILEGKEAGGHVCPVSTMVLIQDVLLNLNEYPIFVAGGILRGEVFSSMLMMGAVGCQMGTVFACAKESTAHRDFKNAFFRASGRNAVTTIQLDKRFPISLVRALENNATDEFMKKQKEVIEKFENREIQIEEGRLILEKFYAGSLRRAVQEGDIECGSLMAGQIVQAINEERSIEEIINTILSESENYLSKLEKYV